MKPLQPLSPEGLALLACPECQKGLELVHDHLVCVGDECGRKYKVRNKIPILVDDSFYEAPESEQSDPQNKVVNGRNPFVNLVKTITPGRSLNVVSEKNFNMLFTKLTTKFDQPKVLIIGGGELGTGLTEIEGNSQLIALETDIYIGTRTQLVCDAQHLPFKDSSFDAVIIQAVLEYISETDQCIDQIYRVMSEGGLVYAETPFMQQSQAYPDLKRFTLLGHNQAFFKFSEVDSGPVACQGTVLYWAWEFFLCGFAQGKKAKAILRRVARFSGFWLKYFDHLFLAKGTAGESASAYYFMGEKSDATDLPSSKLAYLRKSSGQH